MENCYDCEPGIHCVRKTLTLVDPDHGCSFYVKGQPKKTTDGMNNLLSLLREYHSLHEECIDLKERLKVTEEKKYALSKQIAVNSTITPDQ